jgi:energy-coupling factor transport system substrate-specific component
MLENFNYYLFSIGIILAALAVMVARFEGHKPRAREIVTLAVMCALCVAGRAAFFMLPSFKPVAAIVIIAGVALGAESGFLVGTLAAFVSNFIFGQGPWTPFQMIGFGLVGLFAGLLFHKRETAVSRLGQARTDADESNGGVGDGAGGNGGTGRSNGASDVAGRSNGADTITAQLAALTANRQAWWLRLGLLCVYGGLAVLVVYGPIVDVASLFMFSESVSGEALIAMLISGLPFNIIHASATVFFLLVLAPAMLEKLERVRVKFGLMGPARGKAENKAGTGGGGTVVVLLVVGVLSTSLLLSPQAALAASESNATEPSPQSPQSPQSSADTYAVLAAERLAEAAETGEVVTFWLGGDEGHPTIIWEFDGARLEPFQATNLPPLDLAATVTPGSFGGEETDSLIIDFSGEGALPIPAKLSVALPESMSGKSALSLYYVSAETERCTLEQPVNAIADGYATFTVVECQRLILSSAYLSRQDPATLITASSPVVADQETQAAGQEPLLSPEVVRAAMIALPIVAVVAVAFLLLRRRHRLRELTVMQEGWAAAPAEEKSLYRDIPSLDMLMSEDIDEPGEDVQAEEPKKLP